MKKSKKADLDYKDGKAIGRAEVEVEQEMGKELVYIPKELAPYSDGQTYSKEKIYAELEVFFHNEALHAQGLMMDRIDIGKRLIILHEISGVPVLHGGDRRSEEFLVRQTDLRKELESRFPHTTKQRRSEYMAVARAAVENPGRFKEWLTGGKNWNKGLAIIRNLEEKQLKALDAGEAVHGVTLDEFDTISREEIVELCRKQKAQIKKGKKQVEAKNRDIEWLRKRYKPSSEEEDFLKQMDGLKVGFMGYYQDIDPENVQALWAHRRENTVIEELEKKGTPAALAQAKELEEQLTPPPTTAMKAAYIEALGYMKKLIVVAASNAVDFFGDPIMCPDEALDPWEVYEQARDSLIKRADKKRNIDE